jgi:hypothetical protein
VPDTETVKQVLAWFAERPFRAGLDVRRRFGGDYRTVIDRASDAVTDLEDAADFVESTGLDELAAAVKEAEDDGDYAAARRGRRALETVRAFRRAAAGETDPDPAAAGETGSEPGDVDARDHFHSGRGTTLGSGAQSEGK